APGGPGGRRPDPLTALGRAQERTERRVDDLNRKLASLADSVATLGRTNAASGSSGGAGGGPGGTGEGDEEPKALPSWLLVEDPDEAVGRLGELVGWLDAVFLRYEAADLPSCWLWHPGVVEELLVLRELWLEAYQGRAQSWRLVGEWHERHRPGVVARLRPLAKGCDLADHRPGGAADRLAATAPVRSALAVLPGMWAVNRDLPYPSGADLDAARRHAQT
ncbi:hypothetical protein BJF78_36380, partial [Pseudonocardia sp. CNS-139]